MKTLKPSRCRRYRAARLRRNRWRSREEKALRAEIQRVGLELEELHSALNYLRNGKTAR